MSDLKPELSKNSKYHISKHRYYELKHFCLQYNEWKKLYSDLDTRFIHGFKLNDNPVVISVDKGITEDLAVEKASCCEKVKMIEEAVSKTDRELSYYIFLAVTEGRSYTYLSTMLDIPCCRDTFYDRYRKFFWCLDKIRN